MPVVVINERFARRYYPGQDPVGRRVKQGRAESDEPWLTIIGIARDTREGMLAGEIQPGACFPLANNPYAWFASTTLVIHDPYLPYKRLYIS